MKYPIKLDRRCKNCDGEIFAKRSRDKNQEFCGRKCVSQYYNKIIPEFTKCQHCDKEFQKTSKTKNMFCSKQCAGKHKEKSHIRICEFCKTPFRLINIAYERRKNKNGGKYCSNICATRKYHFNERFFENIDTEEKAYWVGFICADGNIYRNGLHIHISIKDIEHLKKLITSMNADNNIVHHKDNTITLSFNSEILTKDLEKSNITPKKTFTCEFPILKERYISHFIRGLFDGDGCIYIGERCKVWSIYTASEKMKNQLVENILKYTKIICRVYKQGNGYTITFSKKQDILTIRDFLYKNATVFLERKKDKMFI